ncbi:MAG: AAA family ATPase [bacterium]
MHLKKITFHSHKYPTRDHYPFNLSIYRKTKMIMLTTPITLFVGENGTGKSTLLEALAHTCGIHIWREPVRQRVEINPYENKFSNYISIEWSNGRVPGSFFGSSVFQDFVQILEEWAAEDPAQLNYFGGKSLVTQSHGQSIMSFFSARYQIKGIYLLDEPETALSPKSQFKLLELLTRMGHKGHAQFIIATHSPILLACPGATIYSFDHVPIKSVHYEETDHYKIYKDFMDNRNKFLKEL